MRLNKPYLYLTAALIWGIPGVIITIKGVMAYAKLPSIDWWMCAITLAVLTAFYLMFRRVVERYSAHIEKLAAPCSIWDTFPLRGWVLILFMMGLGISLRHIPSISAAFYATFYSGLGPMLLLSSLRFLKKIQHNN